MTRNLTTALVLGILLIATPALAQTTPQTSTPPPLLPKAPAPSAKATVAFPAEAKVAFINIQTIFTDSNLGKQERDKLKVFNDQLTAGLAARDKEIQGLTDKIRTQTPIVNPPVAQAWAKDLQRLQRELQFAQQEAQVQMEQMQQDLLAEFQTAVQPVIEAVREDKGLWIVFSIDADNNPLSIAAAHPGVDLSAEVVKRLNAGK